MADAVPIAESSAVNVTRHTAGLTRLLIVLAITLPFLEPWGSYDLWPAWGLYASHGERLAWWVAPEVVPLLPKSLQTHTAPDPLRPGWHRVGLERWSLEETRAPVYPQNRFQLGIVRALLDRSGVPDGRFEMIVESRAGRWTARRSQRRLARRAEIDALADHFWFNARPR